MADFENHNITFHDPPLEGYPWDGRFATPDQINEYFSESKITCLLCGKPFYILSDHLRAVHKITPDQYRGFYGIPCSRRLVGVEPKNIEEQECVRTQLKNGKHAPKFSNEIFDECLNRIETGRIPTEVCKDPDMPSYSSLGRYRKKNQDYDAKYQSILKFKNGRPAPKFSDEIFDEFLNRIKAGRTPKKIGKDLDMPSYDAWSRYRKKNKDYDARYKEMLEATSFSLQAKSRCLGARFEREVKRLYNEGKSVYGISKITGISNVAIIHHLCKLQIYRKNICLRDKLEEGVFEEFLRRVIAGRTPTEVCKDPDMPCYLTWSEYRKKNKDYDLRFFKACDALPFKFQAKMRKMGPRFKKELHGLYKDGLSQTRIAEILGVSQNCVSRNLKKLEN